MKSQHIDKKKLKSANFCLGKFRREFRRAFSKCCHASNHHQNYQLNTLSSNCGFAVKKPPIGGQKSSKDGFLHVGPSRGIVEMKSPQNKGSRPAWQRLILTSDNSKRRVTWANSEDTTQETAFA